MDNHLPRLIAFYLPQYHPIPENDAWWGKGFTEWTNVAKARPLFPGHYQPHLPSELGFYDLRLPEVRQAQADLAREHGISGFCYYHYWFNGKRLLERPFQEVLASKKPDFPFCLCWANENWTRTWDGKEREILIKQDYSEADDRAHIQWLINAFQDHRYIKVQGRPLFLVYSAQRLPYPQRTTAIWRAEAKKFGINDLFLCSVENYLSESCDPAEMGFDASVEFQPNIRKYKKNLLTRIILRLAYTLRIDIMQVYRYPKYVESVLNQKQPSYKRFPCIMPSWDNTARRKARATIFLNSHPLVYQNWLASTIERSQPYSPEENFIFINAWNEWGEGNHLEPCQKWGRGYLEATLSALNQVIR